MANFSAEIRALLQRDYDLRIGDYIGEGFDIFKREAGLFIGYLFVLLLMKMMTSMLDVFYEFGSLVDWLILTPCFTAGYYLAADKIEKNERIEFGDFFEGFQYVVPLLISALLQFMIMFAIVAPFGLMLYLNIGEGMEIEAFIENIFFEDRSQLYWLFVPMIALVYLGVSWLYTIPFIVFYKMDAWPALEASRHLISKHWFLFLLFMFALVLLVIGGAICFLVGLLVAVPTINCAVYASFRDVAQLDLEFDNDDLSKHLVNDFE